MKVIVGIRKCGCVRAACVAEHITSEDLKSFLDAGLDIETREGPVSLPQECDRCRGASHPRCFYCGRLHSERRCPVQQADAWEFAGALATALAVDATIEAINKEKR